MDLIVEPDGVLIFGPRRYRCALGRAGISTQKREGDGATPIGAFQLLKVMFREDRIPAPETGLATSIIGADDGWCDDPGHEDYNKPVRLPHPGSCETLWREDHLYDLVVVIGHNHAPPAPGLGSAIFIHVAGADYPPTEGCVALSLPDLAEILRDCTLETLIRINGHSSDGRQK